MTANLRGFLNLGANGNVISILETKASEPSLSKSLLVIATPKWV